VRTAASVLALGAALVALPAPAFGMPTFPGIIQDYVSKDTLVCPVPCSLCHESEQATRDNVRQAGFIVNLRTRDTPITVENPGLLFALQAHGMRACADPSNPSNPCDTDRDGMPDMTELFAERDPDGRRNFGCPKYGCGASAIAPAAPERRELGALWLLAAFGGVVVARRASRNDR
jgi:hypothetical protein